MQNYGNVILQIKNPIGELQLYINRNKPFLDYMIKTVHKLQEPKNILRKSALLMFLNHNALTNDAEVFINKDFIDDERTEVFIQGNRVELNSSLIDMLLATCGSEITGLHPFAGETKCIIDNIVIWKSSFKHTDGYYLSTTGKHAFARFIPNNDGMVQEKVCIEPKYSIDLRANFSFIRENFVTLDDKAKSKYKVENSEIYYIAYKVKVSDLKNVKAITWDIRYENRNDTIDLYDIVAWRYRPINTYLLFDADDYEVKIVPKGKGRIYNDDMDILILMRRKHGYFD